MSENSVPCPCSDCKGKEVSRHIRRMHIRKISGGVEQNVGKNQSFSSLLVAEKKKQEIFRNAADGARRFKTSNSIER